MRWGIIGCGAVTEVKSGPAYQKVTGFEIGAVMARDLLKAQDYCRRHNIEKAYSDLNEFLNDNSIDAVYIATPPDSHRYYALKVLESNKPCCIEKPLATNFKEAKSIVDAFKQKNLPLFVAYYRRSLPRFNQIKAWLNNHGIGRVSHVHWSFCKPANAIDLSKNYNWRTDAAIAPGGYFDDLASHGLDLFNFLLGDIKEATGLAVNQQGLYSAQDSISASWLHPHNVTGSGCWNFASFTREDVVQITGSEGKIVFSVFKDEPITLINKEGENKLSIENPENIQLFHVKNMRDYFEKRKSHPSTGATALHANWVMDKILGNL